MLKAVVISVVYTLVFSAAFANNKVVYGTDSRLDLSEVSDQLHYQLAQSTAAMIPSRRMTETDNGYTINAKTLASRGTCKTERFVNQPSVASCSGFLVGPDLLVTAGHCYKNEIAACATSKWVFGFEMGADGNISKDAPSENVYGCKEVLAKSFDKVTKDDYAIIRLDRAVTDRTPLQFRNSGKVTDSTSLLVIGHPSGIPTKVADGGKIRENSDDVFFVTTLDTFHGNSGSPVFDSETGLIEGILVRGERDYVYDYANRCNKVKVCNEDECRGEDVTRITNLNTLINSFL